MKEELEQFHYPIAAENEQRQRFENFLSIVRRQEDTASQNIKCQSGVDVTVDWEKEIAKGCLGSLYEGKYTSVYLNEGNKIDVAVKKIEYKDIDSLSMSLYLVSYRR